MFEFGILEEGERKHQQKIKAILVKPDADYDGPYCRRVICLPLHQYLWFKINFKLQEHVGYCVYGPAKSLVAD